jgi:hypothetical protein
MESQNQNMPALLQQLHKLPFDYMDGDGIDFEPYKEFRSVKYTQDWFRAWTGNADVDASAYLIFGQDGTGGYAAIWLIRNGKDLLEQPIVFFGSEGELGLIAKNFSDYLWLLASGHGPYESIAGVNDEKTPDAGFSEFAKQHATTSQSRPSEIVTRARAEFPDFEKHIQSLCK